MPCLRFDGRTEHRRHAGEGCGITAWSLASNQDRKAEFVFIAGSFREEPTSGLWGKTWITIESQSPTKSVPASNQIGIGKVSIDAFSNGKESASRRENSSGKDLSHRESTAILTGDSDEIPP